MAVGVVCEIAQVVDLLSDFAVILPLSTHLPLCSAQAAQQAILRRALTMLSTEEEEDLYFSGRQQLTEFYACLVSGNDLTTQYTHQA